MATLLTATWRQPDGTLSSTCTSNIADREADAVMAALLAHARRQRCTDIKLAHTDDITGRVKRWMRPKEGSE